MLLLICLMYMGQADYSVHLGLVVPDVLLIYVPRSDLVSSHSLYRMKNSHRRRGGPDIALAIPARSGHRGVKREQLLTPVPRMVSSFICLSVRPEHVPTLPLILAEASCALR